METFKIYCAGRFIGTDQLLEVVNPFSQNKAFSTYLAGIKEVEDAIVSGLEAEKAMKQLPTYKRYEILSTIVESLTKQKNEVALVLATESGKPLRLALAEVNRAIQTFIVAAEESKRLPGEVMSIDWAPEAKNKEAIIKYFPVGLVAGISPFNFPLNLAVHKIAPAIAAGCPIIIKPASNTPITALLLAQIIDKTDLPKGAFSVLPMDRETGNMLVTDERIKLLSFTGSPDVGWKMKNKTGKKKVVLELGGNAGVIVASSANVKYAAQRAVVGGFAYSGQVCIHAQRFFVHEKHYEAFIDELLPLVRALKTGEATDISTDFSVMIDEKNAIRVETWINEAVSEGAKVIYGGQRKGNLLEPTIMVNTNKEMKVNFREIFGPVITISKFFTFEEAVDMVNHGHYGLQAGVFTNAIDEMNYAFENIHVGGVILNDIPTFRVDHMPYGGIKDSGLGREGVKYAMLDMMEGKILVKNK